MGVNMKSARSVVSGVFLGMLLLAPACGSGQDVMSGVIDIGSGVSRPNILLIIADDLGLDATPGYPLNAKKAHMPTLSGLQAEGVIFENFWAYSECAPTRASILTGRHGIRTGVLSVGRDSPGIRLDELSIQRLLSESTCYSNAVVGKWHLSDANNGGADNPNLMGVSHYTGLLAGAHEDYRHMNYVENGQSATTTQYSTSFFTDQAIAWLQDQRDPWFLWVAYTAPHTPFHLPPSQLHSHTELTEDAGAIASDPLPYYLAMVEALDTEMGRLLAAVDRDKTVVIFIGDNGPPPRVAQAPLQRDKVKSTLYQGGIQVPLVVAGPGIDRGGQREEALVSSTDLFATIADWAGADMGRVPMDSRSVKPLLAGGEVALRDHIYSEVESDGGAWAVRDQRFKLLVWENGAKALYDLQADPYEENSPLQDPLDKATAQVWAALDSAAQAIRGEP